MITIAIPCYKSDDRFLDKAIKSVLEQTSEHWYLILIDGNAQPDAELENRAKSLSYKNVSYCYNNIDRTMAGNWNFAIEQSKTELVCLLHDDDYLNENYVEEVLKYSELFPCSALYFADVFLVNEYNEPTNTVADKIKPFIKPKTNNEVLHLSGEQGLTSLLKGCYIYCPSITYRRSCLPKLAFSSQWKMVTDLSLYCDLLTQEKVLTGINKKLYVYRRHSQNQTAKLTKNFIRFEEEIELYDSVAKQVVDKWPQASNEAKKKRIIKFHLAFMIIKSLVCFDFKYAKELFSFYFARFPLVK